MKEKDIVDFTKFDKDENGELIDNNGEQVGCEICYTHEKAYEYFGEDENLKNEEKIPIPRCPICGKRLIRSCNYTTMDGNAIVSEVNYSNPNGNIGLYSIWECETCTDKYDNTQLFALMPEPIAHNGNHDIYYTGGKDYIMTDEINELLTLIKNNVMPLIMQYVRRVLNPEDGIDKSLNENNLQWWCSGGIEHAIAEWLYNHGYKK